MEIFYVKLDDDFINKLSKIELKKIQSKIGRKIVDYVGEKHFGIKSREIIIENKKPKFQNSQIQFSISHSNKIVAVGFDKFPLGLDIEFMKERDFKALAKHYNINTDDKIEFYKKWTQLEAEIKLQEPAQKFHTEIFENDYTLSVAFNEVSLPLSIKVHRLTLNNLLNTSKS